MKILTKDKLEAMEAIWLECGLPASKADREWMEIYNRVKAKGINNMTPDDPDYAWLVKQAKWYSKHRK